MKEAKQPAWVANLVPPRNYRRAETAIPALLEVQSSVVADANYFRHLFDELALSIPQSEAKIEQWEKTAHQAVTLFADCARSTRRRLLVPRTDLKTSSH